MRVQHCKLQQSCKEKCLLYRSEDIIEISSSRFLFKPHKIYYFKLFRQWRTHWKLMKLEHNQNWFCKLGFTSVLQAIVMLISWIAWVRSLSMTRVEVQGDFLGWFFSHKRSTYTRINTVIAYYQNQKFIWCRFCMIS